MCGPPVLIRTSFIGVPAERVWQAITTKQDIDRWQLTPLEELTLEEGGAIRFGVDGKATISGVVSEVIKGQRLAHTFRFSDIEGESRVTMEVIPMGPMCRLIVVHDGFQEEDQGWHRVNHGWDIMISNLKTLLETGKTLPWPEDSGEQNAQAAAPQHDHFHDHSHDHKGHDHKGHDHVHCGTCGGHHATEDHQ